MRRREGPSSSAASPRGDLRVEVEPELPRPPGFKSYLSLLLLGTGTLIASVVVTACALAPYFFTFSKSRAIFGYFMSAGITSLVLVLAYRAWREACQRKDKRGDRWVGLSLPLFALAGVIGALCGLFQAGDFQSKKPALNRVVCDRIVAENPDQEDACFTLAARCQSIVLRAFLPFPSRYEALKTCVATVRAGKPYPPPQTD